MTDRRQEPLSNSFAGMVAIELVVVLAIFVGAIILVKANAISLKDLQEYFG
jgi:hypothetical protein